LSNHSRKDLEEIMKTTRAYSIIVIAALLCGSFSYPAQAQNPIKENRSTANQTQAGGEAQLTNLLAQARPNRRPAFSLMPSAGALTAAPIFNFTPAAAAPPNLPVVGGGIVGRLTKWTGFTSSNSTIGNSTIFEDKDGLVGIGTDSPTSKLTVAGTLSATSGVFGSLSIGSMTPTSGLSIVVNSSTPAIFVKNTGGGGGIVAECAGVNPILPGPRAVVGFCDSGPGVRGQSTGNTGVLGASTSGFGVNGESTSGVGVRGRGATGVSGESESGTGVSGTSTDGIGVRASSTNNFGFTADSMFNTAIIANADFGLAIQATSRQNTGIRGSSAATLPTEAGIVGVSSGLAINAIAGRFLGTVSIVSNMGQPGNLSVAGTLSKGAGTFKIDHPLDPENKYLYHSFVESPDMMNIYNGNITTDGNGDAVVTLPDYFDALNKDFRYQLTVIGTFAQAIVAEEMNGNRFAIKTSAGNVKVSWQVTGVRNDAFARKNRVQVEEEKPEIERGYYLHPDAFKQPEEKSIQWARDPEGMKLLRQKHQEAEQLRQQQKGRNQ
jgi:hypothetical protein